MKRAKKKNVIKAVIKRLTTIAGNSIDSVLSYVGIKSDPKKTTSLNAAKHERVWSMSLAEKMCVEPGSVNVFASVKTMTYFITDSDVPIHSKIPKHFIHSRLVVNKSVKETLDTYYGGFYQIENISDLYKRYDVIQSMI